MGECENCSLNGKCENKESCMIVNNPRNNVKKIIGVMSGKGGVGKSTISALIARELNKKGYSVGILDADITGPSIPRFFGVIDGKVMGDESGIFPIETPDGIKIMSMNFLMDYEEQPVIWRGPLVAGTVKQFWTDVIWGDLDYLVIDMPPGTGDVALTAMQSIPINGIIMVSIPQDLVSMIVAKAVNMVRQMNIKLIGIVENMSYVVCPDCNKKIKIFKSENIGEFLKEQDIELLGELPMSQDIAGTPGEDTPSYSKDISQTISSMTDRVIGLVNDR